MQSYRLILGLLMNYRDVGPDLEPQQWKSAFRWNPYSFLAAKTPETLLARTASPADCQHTLGTIPTYRALRSRIFEPSLEQNSQSTALIWLLRKLFYGIPITQQLLATTSHHGSGRFAKPPSGWVNDLVKDFQPSDILHSVNKNLNDIKAPTLLDRWVSSTTPTEQNTSCTTTSTAISTLLGS